jgi:hypothetical protein
MFLRYDNDDDFMSLMAIALEGDYDTAHFVEKRKIQLASVLISKSLCLLPFSHFLLPSFYNIRICICTLTAKIYIRIHDFRSIRKGKSSQIAVLHISPVTCVDATGDGQQRRGIMASLLV